MELPVEIHSILIKLLDRSHVAELVCQSWKDETLYLAPKSYAAIRARNWVGMKNSVFQYSDAIKLMYKMGFRGIAPKSENLTGCQEIMRRMFARELLGDVRSVLNRCGIKYRAPHMVFTTKRTDIAFLAREYGDTKLIDDIPYSFSQATLSRNKYINHRIYVLQDIELLRKLMELGEFRPSRFMAEKFGAEKVLELCEEASLHEQMSLLIHLHKNDKLRTLLSTNPDRRDLAMLASLVTMSMKSGNRAALIMLAEEAKISLGDMANHIAIRDDFDLIRADADYIKHVKVDRLVEYFRKKSKSDVIIYPSNPVVDFIAAHCPELLRNIVVSQNEAELRHQLPILVLHGIKTVGSLDTSCRRWCRAVCEFMPDMRQQILDRYHAAGIGEMVEYIDNLSRSK